MLLHTYLSWNEIKRGHNDDILTGLNILELCTVLKINSGLDCKQSFQKQLLKMVTFHFLVPKDLA